jgi:hypothetical protein
MKNKKLQSLCVSCNLKSNKSKKDKIKQLLLHQEEIILQSASVQSKSKRKKKAPSKVKVRSKLDAIITFNEINNPIDSVLESSNPINPVSEVMKSSDLLSETMNSVNLVSETIKPMDSVSETINSMEQLSVSSDYTSTLQKEDVQNNQHLADIDIRANFDAEFAIFKDQNPEEYKCFKSNKRTLVTDNFINTMFAIFQQKWPKNNYLSSFALHSRKGLKQRLHKTTGVTFFPINEKEHWGLLLYKSEENQWEYFDSYPKQSSDNNLIYSLLLSRLQHLFKTVNIVGRVFSHQRNVWGCGFYVCIYAAILSMDLNFPLQNVSFQNYFEDMRF